MGGGGFLVVFIPLPCTCSMAWVYSCDVPFASEGGGTHEDEWRSARARSHVDASCACLATAAEIASTASSDSALLTSDCTMIHSIHS